ncbi:MAG: glycosyltransferase family 39 protein [Thermoanaerobaculia bacterium]
MSRILLAVSSGASRTGSFRIPLLLACAAAAIYLTAASCRDFWSPDEPDFAEAVREMRDRGDYLVPYQNGKPYSEKPILYYWAMAAASSPVASRVVPALIRIPSILSGAFLVFGAAWLAGRKGGPREALVAGAVTAVSPIVFWQSQFLQTDGLFTALLFGALLAQAMIEEDSSHAASWRWVFQLLLPLAVLTKGPLAIVLVGLATLVRAVLARSWRPVLEVGPIRAALVGIAVVVPWYVFAARAGGPEYTYDLIVNQNWNRFFHAFDHIKPWWFYVESIWGDFFPWTLPALVGFVTLWRSGLFRVRRELFFCAIFIAVSFAFLSTSGSKQAKYLLVAYPFAAVLLAAAAGEWERQGLPEHGWNGLRFLRTYCLFIASLLFGAALALVPAVRTRAPGFVSRAPLLAIPLLVGGLGTGWVLFRRRREAAPAVLALAATFGAAEASVSLALLPAIDTLKTGRPFFDRIAPLVAKGEPLAYFGETYHSYPILVLHRFTDHLRTEEALAAWVSQRHAPAFILSDESEQRKWTSPALRRLAVVDRQRVGGDQILLLAIP